MTCDRCEEFRTEGSRFCPFCGEEFRDDCPQCEGFRSNGSAFCGSCGKRFTVEAPERRPQGLRYALGRASVLIALAVGIMLAIETAFLVAGTFTVWDWAADKSMNILGLVPNLVVITTISGLSVQLMWIFLEASILASLALLLWRSKEAMSGEGDLIDRVGKTPLYTVAYMFGVSLILNFIVIGISTALGEPITVPDGIGNGNTPQSLLDYADAAVWEEIITRMVYIGIPMVVAGYVCGRKGSWKNLLGGFGMSRLAVVLIIVSAVIFGFAHMSGWGMSKVAPTFLAGLIMGYLYVKIGIHASIMMHFITDYLAVIAFTGLMGIIALLELVIILLGVICFIHLLMRLRTLPQDLREMPNWVPTVQESIFSRRDRD